MRYEIWLVDQVDEVGLHVTQRVLPTGPQELDALRNGNFQVAPSRQLTTGVVNPLLDVQAPSFQPRSYIPKNTAISKIPPGVDLSFN